MNTNPTIEELEAQLKAARRAEADKAKAEMEAHRPVYRFTVEPASSAYHEERIYDPSIKLYSISGTCINADEVREAGYPDHVLRGGGMVYYYNTASNCIIGGVGGGTIYIGAGWNAEDRDSDIEAMAKVSAFIAEHPEGGDITDIVNEHRERIGYARM